MQRLGHPPRSFLLREWINSSMKSGFSLTVLLLETFGFSRRLMSFRSCLEDRYGGFGIERMRRPLFE